MLYRLGFFLAALAAHASAASLEIKSPRLVVADTIGSQIRAEPFSLKSKLHEAVELGAKDILKLTFQIVNEDGKGVQPHQTFIRFFDEKTGEEGIQPVRVGPSGKAKFELNMQRPPLYLPPTTTKSPLSVSLIIGTQDYDPIHSSLFDLVLPASQPAPVHPDEITFHPQPELFHTFRPEQKVPPKVVSLVFAGIALAPWAVLLGLWSQVAPSPTRLFSPSIFPFVLSLGAFEGLLFLYWVQLKLPQVLLYGAILAIPTVLTGKQALSSISNQRIGSK
ncbi:Dolichyl-diphosphooligosaccharide--protein glycosyltransferase subunit Swp1 [Coprinopsis sp. MPI-PUGE-AT-0042]|nr:Dolichyl-diphosphooligosaccharide--protein glycosyltransferase subunit Swp1 [Coprinopsis sp. MPI-PUGE-AT-0042]